MRPATIRFWKYITKIIKGIVTTIDAAMIDPHGCSYDVAPLNCEITTGTVFILSVTVKVKIKRNSFQAPMTPSSPSRDQAWHCQEKQDFPQDSQRLHSVKGGSFLRVPSSNFVKDWAITQTVNGRGKIK